jgi:hypothetical protein
MHAGQSSSTPRRINDYYPHSILHKITSSFHHSYTSATTNANNHQSYVQDQKLDTATVKERETKEPFLTRLLIVDDEPDVTLTLKVGLEKVTITMDIVTPTANRLYINDYLYIITMKITRERLFLFALIAATIIAVIVAPFVVGQM